MESSLSMLLPSPTWGVRPPDCSLLCVSAAGERCCRPGEAVPPALLPSDSAELRRTEEALLALLLRRRCICCSRALLLLPCLSAIEALRLSVSREYAGEEGAELPLPGIVLARGVTMPPAGGGAVLGGRVTRVRPTLADRVGRGGGVPSCCSSRYCASVSKSFSLAKEPKPGSVEKYCKPVKQSRQQS